MTSSDFQKADYFTLVLLERMSLSSREALRYCVRVFSNRYPSLTGLRYHELEISTAVDLGIQGLFAAYTDGFFAEYFYRVSRQTPSGKPGIRDKMAWIAAHFLQTYVMEKAGKLAQDSQSRPLKALVSLIGLSHFAMKLRYLFDQNAKFFGLFFRLANSVIGFAAPARVGPIKAALARYWVFFLFVFFKFLEWKFSRSAQFEASSAHGSSGEVPAPPNPDNLSSATKSQKICAICKGPLKTPAVVPTAPFAYCMGCLLPEIERTGKCPHSGIRLDPSAITRIYLN